MFGFFSCRLHLPQRQAQRACKGMPYISLFTIWHIHTQHSVQAHDFQLVVRMYFRLRVQVWACKIRKYLLKESVWTTEMSQKKSTQNSLFAQSPTTTCSPEQNNNATYRPYILTKPISASDESQFTQRKQSACQLCASALITRPITNFPATEWRNRKAKWLQNQSTTKKTKKVERSALQ